MWTENVTWFSNEEGKKGRIEAGQLADLVVPDRDFFPARKTRSPTRARADDGRRQGVYGAGDFAARRECAAAGDAGLVTGARFGGYAAGLRPMRMDQVGRAEDGDACGCANPAACTATIMRPPGPAAADRRSQKFLGRTRLRVLGGMIY
jgi:hypothetical protein